MRTAFYLVLVFLAGACWSQVSPKKKVAIFDFENAAVQAETNNSYLRTNAPDLGKGVSELLISKLVQDGNVSVIERNAVDKVLVEQNLTNSNRIDPATAAKLGRLLGVDAIILCTITHYDYDTKVHGGGVGSMLSSSMKSGLGGSPGGSAFMPHRVSATLVRCSASSSHSHAI